MVVVFSNRPAPTFLNTGTTYETFKEPEKQDSFRHLLNSSAKKDQAHSSLKPPLEYNQDQVPLANQGSL